MTTQRLIRTASLLCVLLTAEILAQPLHSAAPRVRFSTLLGGSFEETIVAAAIDGGGNIYAVGATNSQDFPGTQPGTFGHKRDVFVSKFDASGRLLFSRYFGGIENDWPVAARLTPAGELLVAGMTESSSFPILKAMPGAPTSRISMFLLKLSPNGDLLFSTRLGSGQGDSLAGMAVDSTGAAVLAGRTFSDSFPVKNAIQPSPGGENDAFVLQVSPDGREIQFSTYLGIISHQEALAVDVDRQGKIYLLGTGALFTETNVDLHRPGQWVAKLDPHQRRIAYVYYLPGVDPRSLAVDFEGSVFVTGRARGSVPVEDSLTLDHEPGPFLARIDARGERLVFTRVFQGLNHEAGSVIALDPSGNPVIAGLTQLRPAPVSPWNPALGEVPDSSGDSRWDGFLIKTDRRGQTIFSGYWGGAESDWLATLAVSDTGTIVAAGSTQSQNFPLLQPHQSKLRGAADAVLISIQAPEMALFPHFASGESGGVQIHTRLMLHNPDSRRAAEVIVETRDGNGKPLAVDWSGRPATSRLELLIPAGGSEVIRTVGKGALRSGSLSVMSFQKIDTGLVFGGSAGSAGIQPAQLNTRFRGPLEQSAGVDTGLALMNTAVAQNLSLQLLDSKGKAAAAAVLRLESLEQTALFAQQIDWQPAVDLADFRGTIRLTGETPFAALLLRVMEGELETLPLVSQEVR